ncbi:MAG: hypothetical protein COB12_11365 [Flavobacterium sp.]|nr:MAG: hypothetical protein COB12_11365 [Flavobacterium sp.]
MKVGKKAFELKLWSVKALLRQGFGLKRYSFAKASEYKEKTSGNQPEVIHQSKNEQFLILTKARI